MAKAGKKKSARLPKWNDCNLVELKDESSLAACLWHFAIRDRQLSQKARTLHGEDAPMPSMQVEQAWRQFFSKRLNLTWLASEHLYLRVLHLPACEDHDEIKQILEFQLEKNQSSSRSSNRLVLRAASMPGSQSANCPTSPGRVTCHRIPSEQARYLGLPD